MTRHSSRWDHRSPEEWLEQSARFEKMAERFDHHPQLKASFTSLARDAVVRAKDGRLAEARVVGEADWRRAQCAGPGKCAANADVEYFRRRQAQERTAASRSSDVRVRQVHLEMAIKYGALVSGADPQRETRTRFASN